MLEFDLAENLCLREYKTPAFSTRGFLSPSKMVARARTLLKEFDVRGGDPETRAGSLSGGNQQKVVIARELTADPKVIIAAQPTRGLDVGAIEFVHRRLVEERDAGRAVLLVSLELEEIRSLSDRVLVIYEGRIVAELPPESSEEDFGVYMTGGGRGTEAQRERRRRGTPAQPHRRQPRLATYLRSGGFIAPLITVLVAFIAGGLVVLITGHDPIETYKAIFKGTGLQLDLPVAVARRTASLAALNLQQTLIITTPLILTGLAVAFAFRCGLFNIGGQGQYIVGAIFAVWVGSSFDGHARAAARDRAGASRASCSAARLGGHRRRAEGGRRHQRGDHDDHAQLDRDLGRRLGVRPRRAAAERRPRTCGRARVQRRRGGREAAGVLGRPGAAGPARRHLHRARGAAHLLGAAEPHDARLRGPRGRLQPGRGGRRRASTSGATTSS